MSKARASYQQLIAYAAGDEVVGLDREAVEAHLARHLEAAETVSHYRMARSILQADDGVDPPAEVVARAKRVFDPGRFQASRRGLTKQGGQLVAKLIFDSRAGPAPAGLRGQATGFQQTYELADATAELDLLAEAAETDGDTKGWRLIGQLTSPKRVRVELCRAGSLTPIRTIDTDQRGVFVLRTEPGTFDLRIHLPGGVTVVSDIRIS